MTLAELNALEPSIACEALLRCCGSPRWAAALTAARPFASAEELQFKGANIWASLERQDWLEAFAAHPKIGEQRKASAWSASEQSGMQSADARASARISELNAEYEARFGYIFIVCAQGKSASEMLSLLEARLTHDDSRELFVAADEQRKITALRLAKLVA